MYCYVTPPTFHGDVTISCLQLKRALERAEYELKHRPQSPPGELQQWLQLTYEVESQHYDVKRDAAEKQLILAKEMVSVCVFSTVCVTEPFDFDNCCAVK